MKLALLSFIVVITSGGALAGAITTDGTYNQFTWVGTAAAACSSASCIHATDPTSVFSPPPPWTFDLSTPGTIFVIDPFSSANLFEIFDFGVALGMTSPVGPIGGPACNGDIGCAIGNPVYQRGTFSLAVGSHSITIQPLPPSFPIGTAVFSVTSAPEPISGLLVGPSLLLLVCAARARRTGRRTV